MSDETILQVKIRRKDVYDAVRNLLLNEFKILPADLAATVDRKINNRIEETVKTAVERTYGFGEKVNRAIDAVVSKAKADAERMVAEEIKRQVKEIIGERLVQNVMDRLMNKESA